MKEWLNRFERLIPYLQNSKWRTGISLMIGFCVNVGMALFQLITGLIFHSPWLIAAAIYYIAFHADGAAGPFWR